MKRIHPFIFIVLFLPFKSIAQSGASLFDSSILHEIRINFSQENYWDSLTINYQNWVSDQSADDVYTEANITIDGNLVESIGARFKGLSSYYYVESLKKPMKIDLNEFVEGQNYFGIKKFNLHNGAADPSMMRDFVAYDVMRTAGVKVPRLSHTKLYINDVYWGVYGIIEQIDKDFVEANFPSDGGTLIKNNGWSELQWLGDDPAEYQEDFQLKTNEDTEDWSDFIHFVDVLNNTSDEEFALEIEKVFDVNLFLHVMAVDVMLDNWDSYFRNQRNWYLYHEPNSGKMQWIPWDYNLSLGGDVHTVGNPYPPIDASCNLIVDFSTVRDSDNLVSFIPKSNQELSDWRWETGDGNEYNTENPAHSYESNGSYNVCFYGSYEQADGSICEQRRCKEVDLSFLPAACNTIINGTCPYPATDPIYQEVVAQDSYCCNDTWDAVCNLQYYDILLEQDTVFDLGVEYNPRLSLIIDDSDKVLADRILAVPEFRQKYLDIVCVILENNFNEERLFPLIEEQSALINEAIYEDPNYIFTWDYYEYDQGDGSGGGNEAEIPALKSVLNERFLQMENELLEANQDCENAFSSIAWNDLVINEFMASNNEDSGIVDPNGQSEDWIELYNNSDVIIDLTHFYLSDNTDPFKWQFPIGTTINPDEYLIIWGDKDEMELGLHANFKISKQGGIITLTHEDRTLIDEVVYEEQTTNLSYARIPNGLGYFSIHSPSFNENNETLSSNHLVFNNLISDVYPNPAKDYFIIEFPFLENEKVFLRLNNVLGQVIIPSFELKQSKQRIDLNKVNPGVYFLEIRQGNQTNIKKINIH